MASDSVYKAVLLDHFHNPRNKGELEGMDSIQRGSNPRCGDDIEVGVNCENDIVKSVRFRGRGCSICLASASMMSECASGLKRQQLLDLSRQMQAWFDDINKAPPDNTTLAALGAVRAHKARKKCVLLAWEALDEAMERQIL